MNSEWLIFEYAVLWPTLIAGGVIITLILREFIRENTRTRWLNIFLNITAVAALLLIWARPQVLMEDDTGISVLVTDGFSEEIVDSLKNRHPAFYYDSMTYAEQVELITNNPILVVGHGIPKSDIQLWKDYKIRYYDQKQKQHGISRLRYTSKYKEGETMRLSGLINREEPVSVLLTYQGHAIDSVQLAVGDQSFELQAQLESSGRYIYEVEEHSSEGSILSRSELPVMVKTPEKFKLLMLNSFPTFELKYLKNFLVSEGHELVVRNQLTKGKYKYEYYNTDNQSFRSLDSAFLSQFDMLITDHVTLKNFSRSHSRLIKRSIESGLGLLVLPDEETFSKQDELLSFNFSHSNEDEVSIALDNRPMKVETYGYEIQPSFGQKEVIDKVSVYKRLGRGRIGITVLKNTYQLVLDGNEEAYQMLWIKQLASLKNAKQKTQLNSDWLIFKDSPTELKVNGLEDVSGGVHVDNSNVAMIQDTHLPTHWRGVFWPKVLGWQSITFTNSADTLWFYAQGSNNWKAFNIEQRKEMNARHFKEKELSGAIKRNYASISLVWFYLLFLISVAYLWLEPKLT